MLSGNKVGALFVACATLLVGFTASCKSSKTYESELTIAATSSSQEDKIKHLRLALAEKPDDDVATFKLAMGLQEAGERDEALSKWRKLSLSKNPTYAKVAKKQMMALEKGK